MAENERGFHNPRSQHHDHNRGGSSAGGMPEGRAHKHMAEPTNHGGHTFSGEHQREHDARTEATRRAHGVHGHMDGLSKHGADHHFRTEHESAAEREREGEGE